MKQRLDIALVEQGFLSSREQAKALIMAGQIYVNGQKSDKPGTQIKDTDQIELRGEKLPFVSRGGKKLAKAIDSFVIKLEGLTCADIGASTGGFTDCMLQNGAKRVYAIDVGYGQLAWQLRTDERVINLERTNIRYITEEQVPEQLDFASVDVSFISLTHVLPVAYQFLKPGAQMVCLVKPQFEAGREKVGKKGVVKDPEIQKEVIVKVAAFAIETGFTILGLDFSPIKGPEGNIEFLLCLRKPEMGKGAGNQELLEESINCIVQEAHQSLNPKT